MNTADWRAKNIYEERMKHVRGDFLQLQQVMIDFCFLSAHDGLARFAGASGIDV